MMDNREQRTEHAADGNMQAAAEKLSMKDLEQVSGGMSPYYFMDTEEMYPGFKQTGSVYCDGTKPLPCPACGADYMDVRFGVYKGKKKWICSMCGEIHDLDLATETMLKKKSKP